MDYQIVPKAQAPETGLNRGAIHWQELFKTLKEGECIKLPTRDEMHMLNVRSSARISAKSYGQSIKTSTATENGIKYLFVWRTDYH